MVLAVTVDEATVVVARRWPSWTRSVVMAADHHARLVNVMRVWTIDTARNHDTTTIKFAWQDWAGQGRQPEKNKAYPWRHLPAMKSRHGPRTPTTWGKP